MVQKTFALLIIVNQESGLQVCLIFQISGEDDYCVESSGSYAYWKLVIFF